MFSEKKSLNLVNDDQPKTKRKLEWYWAPIFVAGWFLLYYVTVVPSFHYYPKKLMIRDESNHPGEFIGERAELNLLKLSSFGVKTTGSVANEELAVNFLLDQIKKVKDNARLDLYDIEEDLQEANGSRVNSKKGVLAQYQALQNVVVKFTPKQTKSTSCLLINSHFDSEVGSPGAGDDGIMVVIMLEVLRVMSQSSSPLAHSVIFLFNGAEEVSLQGSHAFITQHKWAPCAKALINLDSAGSGGREILFQSGPNHPWLMKYYSKSVPHPYASTMGEELFQNNFVPSDSDFRIFRDYGNVPGLDMAHSLNGYVYHTKYDRFNVVEPGSYQTTGENILALAQALSNAPELEDPSKHAKGHTIFFDWLGWFMIFYTETTGYIINVVVCVLALISIVVSIWMMGRNLKMTFWQTLKKFGILLVIQILTVAAAIGLTLLMAVIMDAIGLTLSWYSNSWLVFGLYFCPMFFILGILPAFYLQRLKQDTLTLNYAVQLLQHSHCILLIFMTLFLTILGIRSSYIFFIAVFFYSIAVDLNLITQWQKKQFVWMVPVVLSQVMPFMFYTFQAYSFNVIFIPMQARSGVDSNPELFIAICASFMTTLFAGFIMPLMNMFRKSKILLSTFGVLTILFVIIAATPVGFPYREATAPQRFNVFHTSRVFHNFDGTVRRNESGFFVMPADRRPESIKDDLLGFKDHLTPDKDCENEMFCGYPLYRGSWKNKRSTSYWIIGSEPALINPPVLQLISKSLNDSKIIRMEFELSGPDHMELFINGLGNYKIVNWSLNKDLLSSNIRPPYFIFQTYGNNDAPLKFTIDLMSETANISEPVIDISANGHFVNHKRYNTPEYNRFLDSFPKWAHPTSWIASFENYKLQSVELVNDQAITKWKLEWYWAPIFVAGWFLLYYVSVVPSFYYYPNKLMIRDESNHPGEFIGERAELNLLKLSSLGVKITGSIANEEHAVNFLLNEIKKVQNKARLDLYDIEEDLQETNGSFMLKDWNMLTQYQAIRNVVVKFTPKQTKSTSCLLINSHFDSEIGSPGAGDDGIMVVIMLEVLRVMSQSSSPLAHSVIFLFNGAEENPLQGSHAFITQHKWAPCAKALINLDSAGSGGREILFQSGPNHPWLMKYYSKSVPHPYASTLAEELFQNDFIPSDSDFRIFRDFGNVPGLDMAHSLNGYVYHTKYDKFNVVEPGSYQTTGENILALAQALSNAPELEDPSKHEKGHTVFFDWLGWFMIFYTETTGIIINVIVCILALASIGVSIWLMGRNLEMAFGETLKKFGILLGIQTFTVIAAIGLTLLMAVIMDAIGLPLSWYSNSWLLFGLYYCPMFFILGILPAFYLKGIKEDTLTLNYAVQLLQHSHCILLIFVTLLLTILGIRSSFIFLIAVFFYSIAVDLNLLTRWHSRKFLWMVPVVLSQAMPFMFYTFQAYSFYITFIPMQARSGSGSNPEVLIAVFTALVTTLFAGFIIPLMHMFRKSKTMLSTFAALTILFIIIAATPAGFPYKEAVAPQRFYALHSSRVFHNFDGTVRRNESGYYIMPVDRRPKSIKKDLLGYKDRASIDEDCEKEMYCGLPLYSGRWIWWGAASYWIPGSEPALINPPVLQLISKTLNNSNTIRMEFELSGPDHMVLFIDGVENYVIKDWSFDKTPLEDAFKPPYFIFYTYANNDAPLKFIIYLQSKTPNILEPVIDISASGHWVYHEKYNTPDFNKFLASFPKWVYPTSWITSIENWKL